MNSKPQHVILAEIPGSNASERMVVLHCSLDGESRIELQQQTWGEGIGWFTQNTMSLEPQQVAQLRDTLGGKASAFATPTVRFDQRRATQPTDRPQLRIHSESA